MRCLGRGRSYRVSARTAATARGSISKSRRNSSSGTPSESQSNNCWTGSRVPRKQGTPLIRAGSIHTACSKVIGWSGFDAAKVFTIGAPLRRARRLGMVLRYGTPVREPRESFLEYPGHAGRPCCAGGPVPRGQGLRTGDPLRSVTWWRRIHFEDPMTDSLCDRGHTPSRPIGHRAVASVLRRADTEHNRDVVPSVHMSTTGDPS